MNVWDGLHRQRWLLAAFAVIVTAACLPGALRLDTDPSNAALMELKSDAFGRYQDFQRTFGNDDNIVIALGDAPIFTTASLDWLDALSRWAQSRRSVIRVESLTTLEAVARKGLGIEPVLLARDYLDRREDAESFYRRLKAEPELFNVWVSADERTSVVVLTLAPDLESQQRHNTIEAVRNWLRMHKPETGETYMTGTAVEQDAFISHVDRDNRIFVPFTLAVVVIALIVLHGRVHTLLYPVAVIASTMLSTQSIMFWSGHRINPLTVLVAPVILVVSVADAVHVQAELRSREDVSSDIHGLAAVFQILFRPCLLTTATTMVGFGALVINPVPAVRQFGWFAAVGTGLAFVWTVILAPFFIHLQRRWMTHHTDEHWQRTAEHLAPRVIRYRLPIIAIGVALLLLSVGAIPYIHVSTDLLESFTRDDPFRRDTERIQQAMGGIYPLEVVIAAPSEAAFTEDRNFAKVKAFRDGVARLHGVDRVRYLTDLINMIDRSARPAGHRDQVLPPTHWLDRYFKGIQEEKSHDLDHLMSEDFTRTRLTLWVSSSDTAEVIELEKHIRTLARAILPPDWRIDVTGQTYLLARVSQRLVQSELKSMACALAIIFVMIAAFLRSVRLALASLLPNAVPISVVLAVMSFGHISLNTATATITCVAIGLIVDNTIHLLYRFKEAVYTRSRDEAVESAVAHCARPIIGSSIVLAAGFAVTMLGSIRPTVQFGFLMVIVIFVALFADLLFLPAILSVIKKKAWAIT